MSGAPVRPRPGPRLENTERYGNYPPYPGDYADKRYSSSSSSSSPEYSYGTNRRRRETDDFGVSDERSEKKSVWWT